MCIFILELINCEPSYGDSKKPSMVGLTPAEKIP
jgi:hypothetical protein